MANWSYSRFVRYVANNTDSEQMVVYSDSELDERKFVDNAVEYLGRFWAPKLGREYTPQEWKTGKKGKPMAIDLVRFIDENQKSEDREIDIAIEVKFIITSQDFTNQILEDVLRLLSLQIAKEKYLLIGGRKEFYNKVWQNEAIKAILPLEHDPRFPVYQGKSAWARLWAPAQYHALGNINIDRTALPKEVLNRLNTLTDGLQSQVGREDFKIDFKNFNVELKSFFCPRGDWGLTDEDRECDFIDVRLWKFKSLS